MMNKREPATETDVRDGAAIFYVTDSRSKPFDLGVALPVGAVLLEDAGEQQPIPAGTRVQIIQAEILDDSQVLLGFTYANNGQGICTLDTIAIESDDGGRPGLLGDIRAFAYELLEEAKQGLQQSGQLDPLAFVITNNKAIRLPLSFHGVQQKHGAYNRLVQLAKAHRALAIITVNDVHLSSENDDDDGYYDGKLAATKSPEAIWVTVSGPAITSWSITAPYARNCEQIAFGPAKEDMGVKVNLLQGWASEHVLPKN
jgi:hypothetical protein